VRSTWSACVGLVILLLAGCERPPAEPAPADAQAVAAQREREVRQWWKACRAGGQTDCARLEALLASDSGFKARVGTDAGILAQVCRLGDPDRCLDLGLKLFFGVGVPRDPAAADAAMAKARLE